MRKVLMAAALAGAAVPALAADPKAFAKLCEAEVPVASCGCMVNELQQSRDGQIVLDATVVGSRPESERKAAALALANKYAMKMSEIQAVMNRSKPVLDAAAERCK